MIQLHDSGSTPVIIFIFLNKRDQKVSENNFNHFPKKHHVGKMGYFRPKAYKYKHPSDVIIDPVTYPEFFGQTTKYNESSNLLPFLAQSE